jgi:hypothetical protein
VLLCQLQGNSVPPIARQVFDSCLSVLLTEHQGCLVIAVKVCFISLSAFKSLQTSLRQTGGPRRPTLTRELLIDLPSKVTSGQWI